MAIPHPPSPPPPPGPPPSPSIAGLKLSGGAAAGGAAARSALLQSIQKGTKLKKTTTVDKSGPALAGKICDGSSSKRQTIGASTNCSNNNNNNIGNGAPKLGGLFEGLTSMPKLKPVNGSRTPASTASLASINRSNSPPSLSSNTTTTTTATSNTGSLDFNAELTKHLTLKRQKQQQQTSSTTAATIQNSTTPHINATEANLKTNRGPPPQPPSQPPKNLSTSTIYSLIENDKINGSTVNVRSLIFANNEASIKQLPPPPPPTISDKFSDKINTGGSVRNKAANLNLCLGNNNIFVNNNHNNYNNITTTTTTSINSQNTINNMNNNSHSNNSLPSSSSSTLVTSTSTSGGSLRNLAPNKSTLFGGGNTGSSGNGINSYNSNGIDTTSPSASASPSPPTKSPLPTLKPNHGKPNFAPKPPGLQKLAFANGQRPSVARHHSMKSPRSPPISVSTETGGIIFPTQQHFGTMRTTFAQSQEAINSSLRTAPPPPIGRPTVAPPKPPNVKPPPPPTPARSTSNSNLNLSSNSGPISAVNTVLISQASASPSPSSTQPPSTSSSSNSVSALRDQFRLGVNPTPTPPPPPPPSTTSKATSSPLSNNKSPKPILLNGGPINAPPLPPHRTCPAPPPPLRQTSNNTTGVPPVPPQRYSSMRSSASGTPPSAVTTAPTFANSNNANAVSRIVIDLETKYGKHFHNVTEFPKPPPFVNIQKVYPSRTVKTTNGM